MRVPLLDQGQYFAKIIDWSLHPVLFAVFCAFDHESRADHLVGCGYVQQHGLFLSRCDQDWRRRKAMLKVVECGLRLFYPSKHVCLP
jgi:hypothetical protein